MGSSIWLERCCRPSDYPKRKHRCGLPSNSPRKGAHIAQALAPQPNWHSQSSRGKPADALKTLQPALEFFKQHRYRTFELTALTVAAGAYQDLDDIPKAREIADRIVKGAEATGDESRLARAINNLAGQAAVLGSFPEALGYSANARKPYIAG